MVSKEQIKSEIVSIIKNFGVTKAAFFGSVVRGDRTMQSDIDILVEFEDGKTLLDLVGLKIELEEHLKIKVDVVTYDALHPRLKDSVLKEQEMFYEAEAAYIY